MKPIWTGAIGFGLVNIPVKLYSATQNSDLDLDMLDKKDHSKIRFVRINENTGNEVAWENIVKAYKLDDEYYILSEKDFEEASPEKTKTIAIETFVKESEINSIYYETPYYVEPDKTGARPYALLREALIKTGKVGIATFVMRNKEHLAVLKAESGVMILNRIRFYEEIRPSEEISSPASGSIKPAELKMATSLVDQLTEKFDIKKYKDLYNEKLLKLIQNKAKGVKTKTPNLKVVHSKADDLMSQLKKSLEPAKKNLQPAKKSLQPAKRKKAS